MRHLDECGVRRHAAKPADELACARGQIESDLHDGYDLPVIRKRGVERTQGVRDPAPLLDRYLSRIAAVDRVPDEGTDDTETLTRNKERGARKAFLGTTTPAMCFLTPHASFGHTSPSFCDLNVAIAPTTPAVPGRIPGTMRQASTAGRNARRFTSARSGSNSLSPALVTPPAMTTTSGLKTLSRFATPVPRNFAVSRTTSRASPSPRFAASYTVAAVIASTSSWTILRSMDTSSRSSASRARSAIAGPDAYASRQP